MPKPLHWQSVAILLFDRLRCPISKRAYADDETDGAIHNMLHSHEPNTPSSYACTSPNPSLKHLATRAVHKNLVDAEAASTGPRSPEVAKVTYWSVIDMQQMKIGVGVLTTLYVVAFGMT
jgi:hypothetical protein